MRLLDRATSRLPQPWRTIIDWAVTIAVAAAIVLAVEAEVAKPFRIPSASMEPTLHCARPQPGCEARFSDRVIANRLAYHLRDPHRGEIVVFHAPAEAAREGCGGGIFVKRIIGLPGETVREQDGRISIDGQPLRERYLKPEYRDYGNGRWRVPLGHYFLLGDNRARSCDSRRWGPVPRSNLIGPILLVYWPPDRIGLR